MFRNFGKRSFCTKVMQTYYNSLHQAKKIEFNDSQFVLVTELDRLLNEINVKEKLFTEFQNEKINFHEFKPEPKIQKTGLFKSFFKSQEITHTQKSNTNENYHKLIRKYDEFKQIRGIYVYGTPGCGKTFMMDLFFEKCPLKGKLKTHFNTFMLDIHQRLHKLKNLEDPLNTLSKELSKEYNIICFDEFQVTDIADAMILKRLFEQLYANHIITVCTSNRHPNDLYLNGLQRHLFLPFIDVLKSRTNIVEVKTKDFRIRHDIVNEKYLSPINQTNIEKFNQFFEKLTRGNKGEVKDFEVMQGRKITCNCFYKGVALFDFDELCDRAVGAADYISIASNCSTVLIKNIPEFSVGERNILRRFILLIDELYNHNCKIYCLGEKNIDKMFKAEDVDNCSYDEVFAFDRTVSRIKEMQTEYYFKKDHIRSI